MLYSIKDTVFYIYLPLQQNPGSIIFDYGCVFVGEGKQSYRLTEKPRINDCREIISYT